MFDYLPSPEDVIAVRASGKLLRPELESLVDRFTRALDTRDRTHVFVEVTQLTGLELDGMPDHLRRTAPMLGKLRRLGRVAVVADQSWLRWATRVESAVLPHVSYEVFTPDEREQAWRWVLGEDSLPHGPALSLIETGNPGVIAFEIDGKATETELRALSAHFRERIAAGGRFNILGRIKRLGGFEMGGLLEQDFMAMKRGLLDHVDRYAIVGGPAWLRGWVRMLDGVLRIEVRCFAEEGEAEAWGWVGAEAGGTRAVVG